MKNMKTHKRLDMQIASPSAAEWLLVIMSEYDSLIGRKTWELVDLPLGRKTMKCMWVFKTKRQADGNIARYKARLCGKGLHKSTGRTSTISSHQH
jgi:hypothetical protein